MSEGIPNIIEVGGAILGTVAGAVLAIDKTKTALMRLSNFKPMLRKSVKADLELFRIMKEGDPGYDELKEQLKKNVASLIKEEKKREIINRNWVQIIAGIAMAGGFGYWSFFNITHKEMSNWWLILSIWMALAGLGFLQAGFLKSSKAGMPPQTTN